MKMSVPSSKVVDPRNINHAYITTELLEFAECPKHSAKDIKHSANGSPSVTLGEQHSPKTVTAKPTLPSVFYRALGKAFAECPTLGKVETEKNPKKIGIFTQKKMEFFLSMEAPTGQRPPISDIFRVNFMATRSTRFEPETSRCARTSSTITPHSHLCLDSVLVPNILY